MEKNTPSLPPLEQEARGPVEGVTAPVADTEFTPWPESPGPATEGSCEAERLVPGPTDPLELLNLPRLGVVDGADPRLQTPQQRGIDHCHSEQHLLIVREEPEGSHVPCSRPETATGSPGAAPSPLERPGIRLIETRLDLNGLDAELYTVATPTAAASVFYRLIGEADREHFAVLMLDNRHRMTHAHIVSRGTAQSALVHPREVFKAAVLANAAALIIGHNHPSGGVQPSSEDRAVNARIESAGELLGIRVLDSIIVGPTKCFHATSLGGTQTLSSTALSMSPAAAQVAENELATICRGLMRDIEDVLERQGEEWWDETVTSGTYHRGLAERRLGLAPYRPLPDAADPTGSA